MSRMRFFFWLIAGPVAVLGAMLAAAHPYLSITEPNGGDVLVVEGWMEPPQLKEAARIAIEERYRKVYTTGSVRPFAYYLRLDEAVEVRLREPAKRRITVNVSGTTGAGFLLIADGDTLLRELVGAGPREFAVDLKEPVDVIRIKATNTGSMDMRTDDIFIQYLRVSGENAHQLQATTTFIHADGSKEDAWPTYAHIARARLVESGIPADRVVAVPAWGRPDSRSWANANYMAVRAKADSLTGFDVATSGVHARRSRALFAKACGPTVKVGVISIPDPLCPPGGWWKHSIGWWLVLKEVAGTSESVAVEIAR